MTERRLPPDDGRHVLPTMRDPAHVLAWSESCMEENGPAPSLALWLPAGRWAAIGIGQKTEHELAVETMRRDGVGLIRRQSGGGAVLLYEGVLCWEAWAGFDELERRGGAGGHGIRQAYSSLSMPVVEALRRLGVDAVHAGICDISIPGTQGKPARKLAGTAQLRRRNAVLVHGSLLVTADVTILSRYLLFPSEQPKYRESRSHRDFCATVEECLGAPDPGEDREILPSLADAIRFVAEEEGWSVVSPPEELPPAAKVLRDRKYRSEGWNWNRERPDLSP